LKSASRPSHQAEVLSNPQTTYRSSEPGKPDRIVILGATATGRRLKVVVDAADPQFVVTIADRGEET
jgi:hypothetical protein